MDKATGKKLVMLTQTNLLELIKTTKNTDSVSLTGSPVASIKETTSMMSKKAMEK